ncbi:hypothetical protein L484_005830 [Morus notabilis]|uniref:Uncharacterized protein n=1 Tax=Morus notabilis TaxID=981085 RepID=W9RWI2_9ROSA|nr:UPF0481 protein At3g47200 [Morus notabilis]XP_024026535.1 UPF0481 protein At3g47200 [Morus notabilis]XP_024026536.1 UPF0481 protein At3g47200 [Morus notabilis]EXC00016.1 hypothetical protein L484_005830 [Morus notabilis]
MPAEEYMIPIADLHENQAAQNLEIASKPSKAVNEEKISDNLESRGSIRIDVPIVKLDSQGSSTNEDVKSTFASSESSPGPITGEHMLLLSRLKTIAGEKNCGQDNNKGQTKIQKVPDILLRQESCLKYYKPRAISIGPIHNGSKDLMLKDQDLKEKLAAKFIKDSGKSGGDLFGEIKAVIEDLKKCFNEAVISPYGDDSLAMMLFLDGSSILEFIHSCAFNEVMGFEMNNGQVTLIQQDLFLLENQIPFLVLKLLMNASHNKHELKQSLEMFIRMNVLAPEKKDWSWSLYTDMEVEQPLHLLDLLRKELLKPVRDEHIACFVPPLTLHQGSFKMHPSNCHGYYARSFRNVQDLKAAGIKLKPSETSSLRDITFTSLYYSGHLKLPPLIVDDSTGRKLLNLVAFEMCPDNYHTVYQVTSYLSFLDLLIDNEEDVKDLRSAYILRNRLSSDAEVAQLFNAIGTNLVRGDAYVDVKIKIQRYYERRCATWVAQIYRDHFSSPWTILALIAAVTALLLTGIQTWFAFRPCK